MAVPITTSHDPAFWAAVAGGASAVAAVASLLGLAQTVRQARRTADAAEDSNRRQVRPIMVVSLSDNIPSSDSNVMLTATNAGNGVALACVWALVSEAVFEKSTNEGKFNRDLPIDKSRINFLSGGKPIPSGGVSYFEIQKPNASEDPTCAQINYTDAFGNAHQASFAVILQANEPLVLNMGSTEYPRREIDIYRKKLRKRKR